MQLWPARRVTKLREHQKAKCTENVRMAVVPGSAISRHFPAQQREGREEEVRLKESVLGEFTLMGRCRTS